MSEAKWNSIYAQVQASPDDFELWQDLVDAALAIDGGINRFSAERSIQLCRFTFDGFLDRFPMLQGYWKKYADIEFKLGHPETAFKIYERGLSLMPGCIELWVDYCSFRVLVDTTTPGDETRRTFERAVEKVGNHFLSHELWDLYIDFEQRDGTPDSVFNLLMRVIRIPLHQYAKFFDKFRKLAKEMPVNKQADQFFLNQFRAEYELERDQDKSLVDTSPEVAQQLANADLVLRLTNYHNTIYTQVQEETHKRFAFESAITRPYFHLAYLPEDQFDAWRRYLSFEEVEGDFDRICLLYERAIIPTCLSEEFWLRYARWLISKDMAEHAREVLQRACTIVPIGRVALRHFYAKFLLSVGEVDSAKLVYTTILQALPTSVETAILLLSLEYEQNGKDAAVLRSQELLESPKWTADDKLALLVDLAFFYTTHKHPDLARNLYEKYMPDFSGNFYFWKKYLLFEIQEAAHSPGNKTEKFERIQTIFNLSRSNSLDPKLVRELVAAYSVYLLESGMKTAASEFLMVDGMMNRVTV